MGEARRRRQAGASGRTSIPTVLVTVQFDVTTYGTIQTLYKGFVENAVASGRARHAMPGFGDFVAGLARREAARIVESAQRAAEAAIAVKSTDEPPPMLAAVPDDPAPRVVDTEDPKLSPAQRFELGLL